MTLLFRTASRRSCWVRLRGADCPCCSTAAIYHAYDWHLNAVHNCCGVYRCFAVRCMLRCQPPEPSAYVSELDGWLAHLQNKVTSPITAQCRTTTISRQRAARPLQARARAARRPVPAGEAAARPQMPRSLTLIWWAQPRALENRSVSAMTRGPARPQVRAGCASYNGTCLTC